MGMAHWPMRCLMKSAWKNGWQRTLPGRDFSHVDLLQLSLVGDASLIILGDVKSDARTMTQSSVWQNLPAVKEGRVYSAPQLWSFGARYQPSVW